MVKSLFESIFLTFSSRKHALMAILLAVIMAFLAVLELVRKRFLEADQDQAFGNIKLKKI